jgi:hypothetical protein
MHDYPAQSSNWRKLATLLWFTWCWKLAASIPPPTAFPKQGDFPGGLRLAERMPAG